MGANDPGWLAIGNADEILTVVGGTAVWQAPAPGEATGVVKPYVGASAPAGYLLCDGSEVSATTYATLFTVMVASIEDWGKGTKVGDVTTDFGTDEKIDLVAHGFSNGDVVHFGTDGADLPEPLAINTKYFVINKTDNDFEVSLTSGGAAVDITDDGTGTHSVYDNFLVPDLRGRVPVGKDNMGGGSADRIADSEADNLGQSEGSEDHSLTGAQTGPHGHGVTDPGHAHNVASIGDGADGNTGWIRSSNSIFAADANTGSSVTGISIQSGGSGDAHPNVQPYQTLNYIVKT